jgi:multiple sugar transport system permease protein
MSTVAGTGTRTESPPSRPARQAGPPAAPRSRQTLVAWGFALPFFVLFVVFLLVPVVMSLAMAFTDLRSSDLQNPLAVDFVGFDNFAQLLSDDQVVRAITNTAYFVLVGVPLTVVLGLGAAVGLNAGIRRFSTLFRTGYYLPYVTSIIALAVLWRFMLDDRRGLVNNVLGFVGIDGPDWLNSTTWAMPALILMAAWRSMGFLMVVFLAGLQGIPGQLYEAAKIDGAGAWQRFRHVTLPLLRPTLLFGTVITGIGYLQFFEEPFVMTQGGPLNSTLSVSLHIYNQFGFGNYSYAAAMGYALFIAIVALTLAQFRLLRSQT